MGKEFSQEGSSCRSDSRRLKGISARIRAAVGPQQPPALSKLRRRVRGGGAHLVYLHRRGAGIRGQVRPFQVKCPEREGWGEGGAATPLRPPPPLFLQRLSLGAPCTALPVHRHLVLQQWRGEGGKQGGPWALPPGTPRMPPPLPAIRISTRPPHCTCPRPTETLLGARITGLRLLAYCSSPPLQIGLSHIFSVKGRIAKV